MEVNVQADGELCIRYAIGVMNESLVHLDWDKFSAVLWLFIEK